jgi:hypothetical protein
MLRFVANQESSCPAGIDDPDGTAALRMYDSQKPLGMRMAEGD